MHSSELLLRRFSDAQLRHQKQQTINALVVEVVKEIDIASLLFNLSIFQAHSR